MGAKEDLQNGVNAHMVGFMRVGQKDKLDEIKKIVTWAFEKSDDGEFDEDCGKKFKKDLLPLMKPEERTEAEAIIDKMIFNFSF